MSDDRNVDLGGDASKSNVVSGDSNELRQETNTSGGPAIGGDAQAGRDFAGRDTRRDSPEMRGGDVHISGAPGSEYMQLWIRMFEFSADLKLLRGDVGGLANRVDKLERTEVVVRAAPNGTGITSSSPGVQISVRVIYAALILSVGLVLLLVVSLVAFRFQFAF